MTPDLLSQPDIPNRNFDLYFVNMKPDHNTTLYKSYFFYHTTDKNTAKYLA